jgi:hypothetical protein
MNGVRFGPSRSLTARAIAALLLSIALLSLPGCSRDKPVEKPGSAAAIGTPAPEPPPEHRQPGNSLPAEPHLLEASGITVWAKEFEGELIGGLDGGLYEPYRAAIVERVQKALRDRGLYAGPVNGVLDRPTMKSIYAFQEANHNLQRCGVPTPHTRKLLEQGSHTDVM